MQLWNWKIEVNAWRRNATNFKIMCAGSLIVFFYNQRISFQVIKWGLKIVEIKKLIKFIWINEASKCGNSPENVKVLFKTQQFKGLIYFNTYIIFSIAITVKLSLDWSWKISIVILAAHPVNELLSILASSKNLR